MPRNVDSSATRVTSASTKLGDDFVIPEDELNMNEDVQKKEEERVPVFLLKTKSIPNDGYEEQFSTTENSAHFEPLFVPVLEHKFQEPGLEFVRDLLKERKFQKRDGSVYGGLIFTSQRAVEGFAKLVEEGRGTEGWPHLQDVPIYTVGPATSRALNSIPQNPPLNIFGADSGNGEALAHFILDHYDQWYAGFPQKPPLLFLVGEQRRDIIPKTLMDPSLPKSKQIRVDEHVVYGTGVMESFEQNFSDLLQQTISSPSRWVVVFSPTGCEAMLRSLNMLDPATSKARMELQSRGSFGSATNIITIGPTTRDYLKTTFDFTPDVCATQPSPRGVIDGIMEYRSKISDMDLTKRILEFSRFIS